MALDDSDYAQIRRMTERAVESALDRQAQALGARDAEDLARNREKYMRGGDRDHARDREPEPRETDAERKLRERDEADARAAAKKAEDDAKTARDAEAARVAAELQKVKDEAARQVEAEKARLALEHRLLRKDIAEDSVEIVRLQYERAVAALPEAERAKGLDLDAFLIGLGKRAPQVFTDPSKVPQERVETDEEKAAREAAAAAASRTGSGTGPDAKSKVTAPAREDFSTGKSSKELRDRAAKLGLN